jgi:hypothetical protein
MTNFMSLGTVEFGTAAAILLVVALLGLVMIATRSIVARQAADANARTSYRKQDRKKAQ